MTSPKTTLHPCEIRIIKILTIKVPVLGTFFYEFVDFLLTSQGHDWLKASMLRSELIDTLHAENPHLTRRDMERLVAVVLESITQTLEAGARVELRGFGAFSVRHRQARSGRNPRTGESVKVPEKHVPFFRTGKELRKRIDDYAKK